VLDDPKKNNTKILESRAKGLIKLSGKELKQKQTRAKSKYKNILEEEETKIKKKYYVN